MLTKAGILDPMHRDSESSRAGGEYGDVTVDVAVQQHGTTVSH